MKGIQKETRLWEVVLFDDIDKGWKFYPIVDVDKIEWNIVNKDREEDFKRLIKHHLTAIEERDNISHICRCGDRIFFKINNEYSCYEVRSNGFIYKKIQFNEFPI